MADDDAGWIRRDLPASPTFSARVRDRPGLWLGCESIRRLERVLFGIGLAEDFHRIPAADRFGGSDFNAFEAWVERQCDPRGWALRSSGLAEELAGSEAAGLDRWFQWDDKFRADAGG